MAGAFGLRVGTPPVGRRLGHHVGIGPSCSLPGDTMRPFGGAQDRKPGDFPSFPCPVIALHLRRPRLLDFGSSILVSPEGASVTS